MEEKKREKLPIDAKLLSDAVIELNISRRSVGLYPREHPIARESIEKAFEFLRKLFDLRTSITIGIAKDTLVIDEYTLDRRNPVFKEFALSVHSKGIAAITFYTGLEREELFGLHELITTKDIPTGKALAELAQKNGLKHIVLTPLDISKFGFVEDALRQDGAETKIWEDYIYGLLEGRLADSDAEGVLLNVAPEDIADLVNDQMSEDAPEVTYDRVITTYLRKKEDSGINRELFTRFISMVQNLSPKIKQQFLKRAFSGPSLDAGEAERLFGELTHDDIEKVMTVFSEHSSLVPDSLRNLIDKLNKAKKGEGFFDLIVNKKGLVDDVEIDERIMGLFSEDHFKTFVAAEYQAELERMLRGFEGRKSPVFEQVRKECKDEILDRVASEVMLELLESDTTGRDDYLALLAKLAELVRDFLETGRFLEISDIYNTLYSHALAGKYREEAAGMLDFFFYSRESIAKMIDAFKLWGRLEREGVVRLAGALKRHLADSLFDALAEEKDPSIRKFLLSVLTGFRTDILPEAVRRLNDERWYVVRNMIYLIRECGGVKYVNQVKPFAKHGDKRISVEAVKTLLHFNVPGAFPYVRLYLQSRDLELRDQVVRLIGMYRVKEAVPYLLEILEKKGLFGTEWYYKISVVKALGDIGDPRALDTLTRLYQSKTMLYKSAMEELKVEIFKSLSNYPPAAVKSLLEQGLTSKEKEIKAISEKLLKHKGNRNVPGKRH
ncbi:MAG: HEAT repeat domain-containing protein [Nitrospirae bacterium]|nr:HEAT repeat domain-containing protein [Nitrospirota bacterium]MCL5421861.1 HEAT repeat domain-containing protein [Nitrospirota bacterium]